MSEGESKALVDYEEKSPSYYMPRHEINEIIRGVNITIESHNTILSNSIKSASEHAITLASSLEKNTDRVAANLEARLLVMNEFRLSLDDQSRLQLPRAEYLIQYKFLEGKIEELSKKVDSLTSTINSVIGRGTGNREMWITVSAGIVVIVSIAGLILTHLKS